MTKTSNSTPMELDALKSQLKARFPENGEAAAERMKMLDGFLQKGFPTTKHEEWKYTSMLALTSKDRAVADGPDLIDEQTIAAHIPAGLDAHIVVLVNGKFVPALSTVGNVDGLSIRTLSGSENGFTSAAESPFVELNSAFADKGACIEVAKGKSIDKPVCILHFSKASGDEIVHGKTVTKLGEGASATLFESWIHLGGDVLNNHVHEITVSGNAVLRHDMLQASPGMQLVSFTRVEQGANSQYHGMVLSTEGNLIRNNLHAHHGGQNCESHMNGLYVLDQNSLVDNHTLVDHAQPNCYSNELYKGVLGGKSTGVFNGKVLVRLDAQKTNAFQSNRTVLLTKGARMNTKPQLEIFADDVKCSHGATTGRLDDEALFYLRSRGLTHHAAMSLLTYAFVGEVLEKLPDNAVKTHFQHIVEQKLHSLAKQE